MAIIRGGLHGRPSGNVAGVVYGAARTRTGKAVTARELVYPSNPQSPGQVLQRSIFKQSLSATRNLGASFWQDLFNRAIGQLPGFQSIMSILMLNTNASEEFVSPPDTPLGNLHVPATLTVVTGAGAAGTVTITWSTELGINGTANDKVYYFVVAKDAVLDVRYAFWYSAASTLRSVGTKEAATGKVATDLVVGIYIVGQGLAEGLVSPVKWFDVTSHA